MNPYTFYSSELKRSVFLTVYSTCAISIFVSQVFAGAENDAMIKRNNGETEFDIIQKRDAIVAGNDSTSKSSVGVIDISKVIPDVPGVTTTTTSTSTTTTPGPVIINCTIEVNANNKTLCPKSEDDDYVNSLIKQMSNNKDMLLRTLYVTLGVTGVVVVCFVTRAIWLRRTRTKARKYRIIAQNGDQRDVEMEPLGDGNDDDDDYTVFEVNGRKK